MCRLAQATASAVRVLHHCTLKLKHLHTYQRADRGVARRRKPTRYFTSSRRTASWRRLVVVGSNRIRSTMFSLRAR